MQHPVHFLVALCFCLAVLASALPDQAYRCSPHHTHSGTSHTNHTLHRTRTHRSRKSKTHSATITTADLLSGGFASVSYIFIGFRGANDPSAPPTTAVGTATDAISLERRQAAGTVTVTVTITPAPSTFTSAAPSNTTSLSLTTTPPSATNCPALVGAAAHNSFAIVNGSYNLYQATAACQSCNLQLANLTILDADIVRSPSFNRNAWVASWNGDKYGGAPLLFYPGLEIASPLASVNASALCYTGQIDELAIYYSQYGNSSSSALSSTSGP